MILWRRLSTNTILTASCFDTGFLGPCKLQQGGNKVHRRGWQVGGILSSLKPKREAFANCNAIGVCRKNSKAVALCSCDFYRLRGPFIDEQDSRKTSDVKQKESLVNKWHPRV